MSRPNLFADRIREVTGTTSTAKPQRQVTHTPGSPIAVYSALREKSPYAGAEYRRRNAAALSAAEAAVLAASGDPTIAEVKDAAGNVIATIAPAPKDGAP